MRPRETKEHAVGGWEPHDRERIRGMRNGEILGVGIRINAPFPDDYNRTLLFYAAETGSNGMVPTHLL